MDALTQTAGPVGLVVLALIDSTSIGTLLIPIMLLLVGTGGAGRVAARTVLYLVAIAVFYFALGLLLLAGLTPVVAMAGRLLQTPAVTVALSVLGAVLVLWSFHIDPKEIRKRGGDPEAAGRRWSERARRASGSVPALAGLAVFAGMVEAASMVPYLAAVGIIVPLDIGPLRVLALAGYCAVMIAPGLLLAGARAASGGRVEGLLQRINAFAVRSVAGAWSWTVGIVGALLLINTLGQSVQILMPG